MPRTEAGARPRLSVRIVAGLLILGLSYALLVAGDFMLVRWLDYQATRLNPAAHAIEQQRRVEQDQPQIAAAWANGYRPMLFPALFETGEYRQVAQKHGLAPLAPKPHSRLMYCNEGTGLVTYRSDRFGLRNDDALWDSANIDVVLVGDSYVQGACVATDQTIAGHMAASGQTVLNLGTAGNGPIHYAALARAFLPASSPRYAVTIFYANDNLDEEDSIFRAQYIDAHTNYVRRIGQQRVPGVAMDRLAPLYVEAQALADHEYEQYVQEQATGVSAPSKRRGLLARASRYLVLSDTRALLLQTWKRATGPALPWSTRLAINTLVQQCQAAECKPLFAYIPNSTFWRPDMRADAYRMALADYIGTLAPENQLIDTSAAIAQLGTDAYGSQGSHLSGAGYALVAQALLEAMQR